MQTVTVTIGRNLPQSQVDAALRQELIEQLPGSVDGWSHYQLTDESWEGFTTLVREALEDYATNADASTWWVESHDGIGEWDGVLEESRKLTLLLDLDARPSDLDRIQLAISLTSARSGFYQDAVSLTYGDSTLI